MLLVSAKVAAPVDGKKKEILTIPEMAAYLRVHPSTIYRLIWRRQLPVFRVGTDWRIHRDALDQWMASRIQTTSGTPPLRR